jgi:hypothetical protein
MVYDNNHTFAGFDLDHNADRPRRTGSAWFAQEAEGSGGLISIQKWDIAKGLQMTNAHPLAYCPTCKLVFDAPINLSSKVLDVAFEGLGTTCPNGHIASILDGAYETFGDEIRGYLRLNGQIIWGSLAELVDRVNRGQITLEQARAEAERIKPGLGALFNPANWSDDTRRAILVAVISGAVGAATTEAVKSLTDDHTQPVIQIEQNITINPPPPPPGVEVVIANKSNRAIQRRKRNEHRRAMNPKP